MKNEKLPPLKLWSFMFQVIFEIISIWRLRVKGHAPKFVIDCQSWPFKMIPKKIFGFHPSWANKRKTTISNCLKNKKEVPFVPKYKRPHLL